MQRKSVNINNCDSGLVLQRRRAAQCECYVSQMCTTARQIKREERAEDASVMDVRLLNQTHGVLTAEEQRFVFDTQLPKK